jgi:hypothetical protein
MTMDLLDYNGSGVVVKHNSNDNALLETILVMVHLLQEAPIRYLTGVLLSKNKKKKRLEYFLTCFNTSKTEILLPT